MDKSEKITKEMTFGEVIQKYGIDAAKIMMSHGLHCVGCHVAAFESIEQGAKAHGMDDEELETMMKELNELAEKPKKSEEE